jgi:hypothetical protein
MLKKEVVKHLMLKKEVVNTQRVVGEAEAQ